MCVSVFVCLEQVRHVEAYTVYNICFYSIVRFVCVRIARECVSVYPVFRSSGRSWPQWVS